MPLDSPTRLAVRVAGVVTATVLAGVAPTAPDARARPWLLTAHSGPRLVDVAAHDASAGVLEDAVFHSGIEADSLEPASGIEGRVTAAALRSDPDRSLGDRTPPRSLFETPIVGTIGDRVLVWRDGLAHGREPDGSVALGEPVVALALDGATAWALSSAGLIAGIDVREPASPRVVSTVRDDLRDVGGLPATYAQAAIPQPGLLWRVGASPGGTRLLPTAFVEAWDVSDPERPSKTHREWLRGGFGIVDWDRNAALQAGENFSYGMRGIPRENHLAAIDVAAPDTPTMRARLGFDGWPLVAAVHDRVGWIAVRRRPDDAPDGVLAVDLFDPTLPRLLGWWSEPWEELVATGRGVLLRRGDVLATADLDDPLVPRVLDSAEVPMADVAWDPERWHPVEPVIRRSGDGAVVRLADGRLGLVDPGAPGLPVPRVPWVPGAVVREVVGSGERLAWRDEADRWRVARSDAPGLTEHVLVPQAGALASSHGGAMLWLASPEGLHVADAAGGRAIRAMLPITGVRQLAAEGEALWLLRGAPPRIEAWDVAASAPPTLKATIAVDEGAELASRAAIDGRLLFAQGDVPMLVDLDAWGPIARPLTDPGNDVRGRTGRLAWDGEHVVQGDGAGVSIARLAGDGATSSWADVPLAAEPSSLVASHGHAYVFGGANVDVIVLEDPPRRIAHLSSPPAVVSAAIAGDRLLAALGDGGLAAWRLPAPDRPIILERCGTTLRGARSVEVAASGATTVTLRVDGVAVAVPVLAGGLAEGRDETASRDRFVRWDDQRAPGRPAQDGSPVARFDLDLAAGPHILDAVAHAAGQPERSSEPVHLTVDPALAFDPLGVTFDDGAGGGPVGAIGPSGCIDPDDGWTVRLDGRRAIAVRVPVRSDLAAQSTVRATIGDRTAVLAPETEEERGVVVFAGTVTMAGPGTTIDGAVVRIAIDGPEPATWQGGAVAPRVWLPWVGR